MVKMIILIIGMLFSSATPIDLILEIPISFPIGINLEVPFFPQAPDGDWSQPWQDSCEEAAVLLAYYYATDKSPTKDEFKNDISTLVDWQNKNFGSYKDTNIEQTTEMLKAFETRNLPT